MIERNRRPGGTARVVQSGETTQDLRPLPPAPPHSRTEERTRTRGPWMVAIGLLIIAMTVGLAAVFHLGFHHEMPMAFVLPLYVFGFCALLLGCMEYLSRPVRENHLHTLEQMRRVEHGLLQLVELLPEEMQQRFYRGYGTCASDLATGTEGATPGHGTADVLKLRRRG